MTLRLLKSKEDSNLMSGALSLVGKQFDSKNVSMISATNRFGGLWFSANTYFFTFSASSEAKISASSNIFVTRIIEHHLRAYFLMLGQCRIFFKALTATYVAI